MDTTKTKKMPLPAVGSNLNPDKLPVVEFEYPNSENQKMKIRYLRLVSADADYIKGYELENPFSKKDGQFKSFSRNRLTRNSPTLVSY